MRRTWYFFVIITWKNGKNGKKLSHIKKGIGNILYLQHTYSWLDKRWTPYSGIPSSWLINSVLPFWFLSLKSLDLILCCRVPGIRSHKALTLGSTSSGFPSGILHICKNILLCKKRSLLTVGLNLLQTLISSQKILRKWKLQAFEITVIDVLSQQNICFSKTIFIKLQLFNPWKLC